MLRRIGAVQAEPRAEMAKRHDDVGRRLDDVNKRIDENNVVLRNLFARVGTLEGLVEGIKTSVTYLMGFMSPGSRSETSVEGDDARRGVATDTVAR